MSYQVLARKWRPRRFDELVGQEHVVQALTNALDHDRMHHAYLFTGTRGVGKTTLARIFAKSLNCEQGIGSQPCGQCSACRELDEGRFVDLIEVDAASRTKVDQTRELLENVPYAPARGRYKVYLIDEVHMFSDSSFNALLKTLEEPPPHVKFLLATTDPQKVPMTVLSRCLQFGLKRLTPDQIQGQLRHILDIEGIAYEGPALELLAQGADGSMRDGLSLLDQAIAYGGGRVCDAEVRAMLGTIARDGVLRLLEQLAAQDGAGLLNEVARLAETAPDFVAVLDEMLVLLHRIAVIQTVPDAPLQDLAERRRMQDLAVRLSPEDVQLFFDIGAQGKRSLAHLPDARIALEMVLLRMLAFRPADTALPSTSPARASRAPAEMAPGLSAQAERRAAAAPAAKPASADTAAPPAATGTDDIGAALADWTVLLTRLKIGGLASQLAAHSLFGGWRDGELRLRLDPANAALHTAKTEERLQQVLSEHFGRPLRLHIEAVAPGGETPAQVRARQEEERQGEAVAALEADPLVRAAADRLGARLVQESIRPAKPPANRG